MYVKRLLQKDANPDVKDIKGTTPLYTAVSAKDLEGVTLLLEHGRDVSFMINDDDVHGQTALIKIAMEVRTQEDLRIMDILVRNGTNLQRASIWTGRNALFYCGLSRRDNGGETILHHSVSSFDNKVMIDYILAALTPLERSDLLEKKGGDWQMTPFLKGIDTRNFVHAAYLLDFGASPFAADSRGISAGSRFLQRFASLKDFPQPDTPLFHASRKLFHAFAFAPDCQGYSRIFCGSNKVLESYLNHELDPLTEIEDDWSALDFAHAFGKQSPMQGRIARYNDMLSNRRMEWRQNSKPIQTWGSESFHSRIIISADERRCTAHRKDQEMNKRTKRNTGLEAMRARTDKPIAPYDELLYFEMEILEISSESPEFAIGLTRERDFTKYLSDAKIDVKYKALGLRKGDIAGCGYRQTEGVVF
ncbi:hypothetical protein TWF730_007457 [Orbilia blumenaviensis]|uniref:Ankyrin repeat protein n=1 Tax=Orbilia blumenaviensis TaxID=1796055 RepID=A0AAV9VBN3_9PEZI